MVIDQCSTNDNTTRSGRNNHILSVISAPICGTPVCDLITFSSPQGISLRNTFSKHLHSH